uniref:Uncharacterized protein n=1 Tax=Nelumbo nucifera TaxID=4432 RepID=A0A822YCB8_NELNU|nr:TPA_asm: hypothetical protein HUJ06_030113 [Nelumbo nucifera]
MQPTHLDTDEWSTGKHTSTQRKQQLYLDRNSRSSTGAIASSHYILGWSFNRSSQVQKLGLIRHTRSPISGSNTPLAVLCFLVDRQGLQSLGCSGLLPQ